MHISRDVKFDEDGIWEDNPKVVANARGDVEQMELNDQSTPSSSTFSPSSSSNDIDEPLVPRSRRLSDIYQSTDELHLICLLADSEPLVYEDAAKEGKWRKAMIEEIEAVEKNQTWELVDLPWDKKSIGVKWE